jgi:hypothetical protein
MSLCYGKQYVQRGISVKPQNILILAGLLINRPDTQIRGDDRINPEKYEAPKLWDGNVSGGLEEIRSM